jgi:hypothetical protein
VKVRDRRQEIKAVRVEYCLRYVPKSCLVGVNKMAVEILELRYKNSRLRNWREEHLQRVRELELQISDLDLELRGDDDAD